MLGVFLSPDDRQPEVRALCEKYGLPYNTGPLSTQIGSVWWKIVRLALPPVIAGQAPQLGVILTREPQPRQSASRQPTPR